MVFPRGTFGADTVVAAEILCTFCAAILTQLTIGADFHAAFAFSALRTESGAVGAVFTAVDTDVVGTVDADAAVGTEFINTSGALTALLAHALSTVCTDGAAVLADLRTFAALIAVLAEEIIRTFPTSIAGHTEFIRAA